jgi:hypothetical protein
MEMGYNACIPEFLRGFLKFEMGLVKKPITRQHKQPRIGALRWNEGKNFRFVVTNNCNTESWDHYFRD